ncbi:hypothetical protein J2W42_001633 [Rhizobium tibeticum]|nr:hypothetical protein [Rhizobium tibeticum]
MGNSPLLAECGDRLGPQILTAGGAHGRERQALVEALSHRGDHLAALVDLGDHAVGRKAPAGPHHRACPAGRACALQPTIGKHRSPARRRLLLSRRCAAGLRRRRRRIDGNDDTPEFASEADRGGLDQLAPPERVFAILDQLVVQLLTPEPRAAVAAGERAAA